MAIVRFDVFTKEKKKNDGGSFKLRLTKNDAGTSVEVRFVQDCGNMRIIPKDNRPFILVCDSKDVSFGKKAYKTNEGTKYKCILYVRNVSDIEEYMEPEFDMSKFNSATNNSDTDTDNSEKLTF